MKTSMTLIEGLQKLVEDSDKYIDQLLVGKLIKLEIKLTDTNERVTLAVGKELTVEVGSHEPDLELTMNSETLQKILDGEADFGALIGRSKLSDNRPINIIIRKLENKTDAIRVLYSLMTLFFTPGKLKAKKLKKQMAGEAHGAHPIPIVYWNGVRYAWYFIKEGETLNEAGEVDPYPQVFVILNGEGIAQIGDQDIDLSPEMAVYIPINTIHRIVAKQDLTLMWLAWKTQLI
jgi:mannose-6-phosphate isomerase-like protein (cupin superfamily)/putative sterol carrier protein